MYTLVLPAGQIPATTKVRKVTGATPYVLIEKLPIKLDEKTVYVEEGTRFLMGDHSISIVAPTTKLAVDFTSVQDLQEFVELHLESHQ